MADPLDLDALRAELDAISAAIDDKHATDHPHSLRTVAIRAWGVAECLLAEVDRLREANATLAEGLHAATCGDYGRCTDPDHATDTVRLPRCSLMTTMLSSPCSAPSRRTDPVHDNAPGRNRGRSCPPRPHVTC